MTTGVVKTIDDLADQNGKHDILYIVGLELPAELISANSVKLVRCYGETICIDAEYLQVEGGTFRDINTRAADIRLTMTTAAGLTITEPAREVVIHTSAIHDVTCGSIDSIHVTNSWLASILTGSITFAHVSNSYVGNAVSRDRKPFLFAQEAAINTTNWPFADAGTVVARQRMNVFEGRVRNGIPLRTPSSADTAPKETLVSVGWHTVMAFDRALEQFAGEQGVCEALERAASTMERNGKAHFY
jgi:hypothetical protein